MFYDEKEHQPPQQRENELFAKLSQHLAKVVKNKAFYAEHLAGYDISGVNSYESLQELPILHKADIMAAQAKSKPFGGLVNMGELNGGRVFVSPGPIFEPQIEWGGARALFAAGIGRGDIVCNSFSYHFTPGGFILDDALVKLGAIVFPAGTGNSEQQVQAINAVRASAYCGTPDYLKTLLEKAGELKLDISSIKKALVSGGALYPSLREFYKGEGINVLQAYATADLGVLAYETQQNQDSMIINENLIVEICKVGSGEPVAEGEVGEIIVTNFSSVYPLVRFATGDLSAFISGASPCGRTNKRIKGWLGRADQRTKVKGMFIDPKQINELCKKVATIKKARLVIERKNEKDEMKLLVVGEGVLDIELIKQNLKEITKINGEVEQVKTLANDGKIISDEREYNK